MKRISRMFAAIRRAFGGIEEPAPVPQETPSDDVRVIGLLKIHGPRTPTAIRASTGLDEDRVVACLARLESQGLVVFHSDLWWATDKAHA